MSKVLDISDDQFEEEVLQSKQPVLVDFWAEWCGPCKQIGPIVEMVAEELDGKLKVCKMNVDDNPKTPTQYAVRGIPTMILFQGGENVGVKVGALMKSQLMAFISSTLEI